jgi:hypothetical protein
MSDETPSGPDASRTASGFYIPGTHDVAFDDDRAGHLVHCAHCGATLSANAKFCQVCAVEVSGGEDAAADTPAPTEPPTP